MLQSLHPDFRTDSSDTEYFFLGSGKIQAAIQWSRNPQCTPLGIILSDPKHFTRKWGTYLFHPEFGLERSIPTIIIDGKRFTPKHSGLKVCWSEHEGVPNVLAIWDAGGHEVLQSFYIPNGSNALMQWIGVKNAEKNKVEIECPLYANPTLFSSFGAGEKFLYASGYSVVYLSSVELASFKERFMIVEAQEFLQHDKEAHIITVAGTNTQRVSIQDDFEAERSYWDTTTCIRSSKEEYRFIGELFNTAKYGLRAAVSVTGRFDASIWQYGMEWGRDASMVAEALVYSGQFEVARAVLVNILTNLSHESGAVAEASRFRYGHESELDSNGEVLHALFVYIEWTKDDTLIKEHWQRITVIADYLLRDEFLHKDTALIAAARDIWERSASMGMEYGFDVAHQTFAIIGLRSVAKLGQYIGETEKNSEWLTAANLIENSFFHHQTHSMVDNNVIIKRRTIHGRNQTGLALLESDRAGLTKLIPDGMPLGEHSVHLLQPDVAQLFPILHRLVDRGSDIARNTTSDMEMLWSQAWDGGGYGRYHVSGEPDSPGPWALATMIVCAAQFEVGDIEKAMRSLHWLHDKAGAGGCWKEFYGKRPTPPLPPTGVLVWAWAAFITLVVKHILCARIESGDVLTTSSLDGLSARFRQ